MLANKLGITDEEEMEALESGLLLMLYEQLFIEGQLHKVIQCHCFMENAVLVARLLLLGFM
ncbi:hypothetical protein DAQ1742_00636 [Dickeya aquatica]|uniref:Uncharacterized protein n=1 Tax=Dickeya aquatica TaxID=1401087 RepID=A0A375A6W0_9GAMM|nr:hypothetical protein DAQ1742_00636 [Dickeya aquatica]